MSEKIAVALGNVQETLLLPLWGRAVETQRLLAQTIEKRS
jgi:O-methyltransferase involved in polyketide biosynthesis